MIWRLRASGRHRGRASSRVEFRASTVRIRSRLRSGRSFAVNRDEHYRIVRLIAQRTRSTTLHPEIRPAIVDLEFEFRSPAPDLASEIFRHIKAGFLVS